MRIIDALPPKKYAEAAAHAKSPEFQALKQKTIQRVQGWYKDPISDRIPALWFGFGKDSMATALILQLAELEYRNLVIDCGAELPQHYTVWDEWQNYAEQRSSAEFELYETDEPMPQIIKKYLVWGDAYGLKTEKGTPLNFWDWGDMGTSIAYETIYQFHHLYGEGKANVMYMWGARGAEGMDRHFEIAQKGLLQFRDKGCKDLLPYVRALPIGDWLDIDVWALLVEQNAPISPIYSMHQIPQSKGKPFPRTLWYCTPETLSSQFYKWLAYYAPVQLKELCDLFPEIEARLKVDALREI